LQRSGSLAIYFPSQLLESDKMNIFILKLILAPLIIGSASLAGRK